MKLQMTTAQRVARLRAEKRRERREKSILYRLYNSLSEAKQTMEETWPEVDRIMEEAFPTGWLYCKAMAVLALLMGGWYIAGHICMALTGQPLD